MTEPLISVIIPVYNVERYLEQCLDSVSNQTYQNIEIICVNDGSTDTSGAILTNRAESDSRIRIVCQENQGLSGARNNGIRASTGEYIMFVDSDDWIDLNTCETALKNAQEHDADIVFWPYQKEYENRPGEEVELFPSGLILFNNYEEVQSLYRRFFGLVAEELRYPEKADSIVTAWGKLYKVALIKEYGIAFIDTAQIGTEDALFNIYLFKNVSTAVYQGDCYYHYRKDNANALTKRYKPQIVRQWSRLFELMREFIATNSLPESFYQALDNRIALSVVGLGMNVLNSSAKTQQQIQSIRDIVNAQGYRHAAKNLTIGYMPLKWRLFFIMVRLRFSPGVYLMLKAIQFLLSR